MSCLPPIDELPGAKGKRISQVMPSRILEFGLDVRSQSEDEREREPPQIRKSKAAPKGKKREASYRKNYS